MSSKRRKRRSFSAPGVSAGAAGARRAERDRRLLERAGELCTVTPVGVVSLEQLALIGARRERLETEQRAVREDLAGEVDRLRACGVSWFQMARVVGLTEQALQQSWAKRDARRRAHG